MEYSIYASSTGIYNINSILRLVDFYEQNEERLESTRSELKVFDLPYPQMKMLDMGFWQIGFEKDDKKGCEQHIDGLRASI